jgi:aspartyl-tRNA(Asn)/glutamyl-tRNA(Gln) amidotransferase subunit B
MTTKIVYNSKKYQKPDEPHPTLGEGFWLSFPLGDDGSPVMPFPRVYFRLDGTKDFLNESDIDSKFAKILCNLITNELLSYLNLIDLEIEYSPIPPEYMNELAILVHEKKISSKTAKEVFQLMTESFLSPKQIVADRNLEIDTNTGELEKFIEELVASNPKQVEACKLKPQAIGWFIGQIMKNFKNSDPTQIRELLMEKLV